MTPNSFQRLKHKAQPEPSGGRQLTASTALLLQNLKKLRRLGETRRREHHTVLGAQS